jgi:hypothetical protein
MTREEMMQEVDRRVCDLLMDHLLDKATDLHAKQEWRQCDCTFCAEKRTATHYIGLAEYPRHYDGERPVCTSRWVIDPETFEVVSSGVDPIDTKRDAIREWYRQRLSDLKMVNLSA